MAESTAHTSPSLNDKEREVDQGILSDESGPAEEVKETPDQERSVQGVRWLLICIAVFSANLLYGLDNTIVADIQGAVAGTFEEYAQLGWLGVGFTLGSVVFILPLGKAYAIFDTKWLFIGCLTMFAAGSALCGGAPNMDAIIVGRVWAGAGGAGMYLGNLNLITILTTPKEQPVYVGLVGLIYGVGCILGPIIGGAFADSSATWRWGFYINLIIFGIMAPIYVFLLPSLPRPAGEGRSFINRLRELDWVGTVLSAGMHVSFILFIVFGGVMWPWTDGRNIALYVVAAVTLIAFALSQYFCVLTDKENRLFPGEFLRNPTMIALYVLMACGGAALFVAVYYIPLYFQFVHGDSGIMSAVRLLPFICFYVATILLCGWLMPKTGYYVLWYLLSGIFMVIGSATMYTVKYDTKVANIYGYSILLGLGMATTQAAYAVGPSLVTPDRVAESIQFMNIGQGQSQLLGLAIASAIFQSETLSGLNALLAGKGYSQGDIQGAIAGARSTLLTELPADLKTKALDVIVHSIDDVYVMAIAAGALYVIASCFLPWRRF
ncbi:putative MFS transporter [Aspergillus clavatus NRRL 1]|uniref:Efflux pump patC n=1 Tax=Aspergillus clavatus (strain ATCC 1007 / CBS 513.65 / DSM 816 / NCTC 3887 / NRRL 1 / QM 1276 / 107) TaxID=344612 RepID=PATC_ASPCL|nr:MFS transporter, putative [Aspergillus clavatus NRRL 1]A1CFL0.1 RecName: Full=Efflux pump patC; AltName: Full=Patulin synthesis protein C [Aspergillus clavatus NRRL 1]EAW11659.1 MFS transporter, putative [Aspergillus clavatus NRRL 1]